MAAPSSCSALEVIGEAALEDKKTKLLLVITGTALQPA